MEKILKFVSVVTILMFMVTPQVYARTNISIGIGVPYGQIYYGGVYGQIPYGFGVQIAPGIVYGPGYIQPNPGYNHFRNNYNYNRHHNHRHNRRHYNQKHYR